MKDGARRSWRRLTERLGIGNSVRRGVNVVGYLDTTSGLGERAWELVATLRAGGVPVAEWSVPTDGRPVLGGPPAVYDTTIAVVTAVQLAGVMERLPAPFEGADRTIGYFFWELADVPEEHAWGIGLVDEIWAPSRFVADAYRGATRTPVRLQPLPLPPVSDLGARTETSRSEFEVLVSLDLLSVMERKNPLGAIEAFERAFGADEPARMTVKTLNGDRRPVQLARLHEAAQGDDRIVVRDGRLDPADFATLVAESDVLLGLHRSEGLGLHLAEAMGAGTLVVASRYGGNLDFMDDDCAALVDVSMITVEHGEGAYTAPSTWADPDLDQAAAFLRRAYDDPVWREAVAARARERIAASPSRAEIGATLARLL